MSTRKHLAKEPCNLQVKCDKVRRFLHQRSGHIGHASWHGCLTDAYSRTHRCLERAGCVESQSGQHLHLWADGSRSLRASTQSLKYRKAPHIDLFALVREKKTQNKTKKIKKMVNKCNLTSRSSSIRYRMNSLGKPNCECRKLSETASKSKRSNVLWPRPWRSRSQSKIAIGIAILWLSIQLLLDLFLW